METPDVRPHQPAQGHPTSNGTVPPAPGLDADTAAHITAELKLALRGLESVDMRLATVQAQTLLVAGLVVLLLILEVREARKLLK